MFKLDTIANQFITDMSKVYNLRFGESFDKNKSNCAWFTDEFYKWAKSKDLNVKVVYFDSNIEAHIAPMIDDKVIDFAIKQFTKNTNDNYLILIPEDYKKYGYDKFEIYDEMPKLETIFSADKIQESNQMDYSIYDWFEDLKRYQWSRNQKSMVNESINENKMWYKTIPEILEWLESKSKLPFIWLDTETGGLGGPKKQQLTQVSAIATQYDFHSNNFSEISIFDEKIKLTDETKSKFLQPEDKTKWVLGFNHYGSGDYKYKDEKDIVDDFFKWIENYSPNILVAQNAGFDMAMLSGRYDHKINSEVFDTKMLIQLYFLPLLQKLAETDTKYKEMIDFIGISQRDNGLISSSMAKIGPVLGVNMVGYHDAITDCRITIQMYQKIVELLKNNQEVDIMKYQTERIKTIKEI